MLRSSSSTVRRRTTLVVALYVERWRSKETACSSTAYWNKSCNISESKTRKERGNFPRRVGDPMDTHLCSFERYHLKTQTLYGLRLKFLAVPQLSDGLDTFIERVDGSKILWKFWESICMRSQGGSPENFQGTHRAHRAYITCDSTSLLL